MTQKELEDKRRLRLTPALRDGAKQLAIARQALFRSRTGRRSTWNAKNTIRAHTEGVLGELCVAHLLTSDCSDWLQAEIGVTESAGKEWYGSSDFTVEHGPEYERTRIDVKASPIRVRNGYWSKPNLVIGKQFSKRNAFHAYVLADIHPEAYWVEFGGWADDEIVFDPASEEFAQRVLGNDDCWMVERKRLRTDFDWILKPQGVRLNVPA